MTEVRTVDRRRERGERTRAAVLDAAVAMASTDGLDGLSLAALAQRLGVSKSGLFAHWKDKQELQLAVIDRAAHQWTNHIIRPALAHPAGVERVFALHEARLRFYSDGVLPGRCFFFTAQSEYDDRPGPVHDAVVQALTTWLGFLTTTIQAAIDEGDLTDDVSPAQLAFEIDALGEAVVSQSRLRDPAEVYAQSRRAVLDRLVAVCPDRTRLPRR